MISRSVGVCHVGYTYDGLLVYRLGNVTQGVHRMDDK